MKVAILAGGRGTRFGSETQDLPKPLIEVDGVPVLHRVMEIYAAQGYKEFVIALGYRGQNVKRYFHELMLLDGVITIDMAAQSITAESRGCRDWKITLVDTGLDTATGTRLKRLEPYLPDEDFFLTWCDGLADIDLKALSDFHLAHGKIATLTAVHPRGRFGHLNLSGDEVTQFVEKPLRTSEWVNGAFFTLNRRIFEMLNGEDVDWETETLQSLEKQGDLMAYRHEGFWQCMDTAKDRDILEAYLNQNSSV